LNVTCSGSVEKVKASTPVRPTELLLRDIPTVRRTGTCLA
jgi:hypothetical protein